MLKHETCDETDKEKKTRTWYRNFSKINGIIALKKVLYSNDIISYSTVFCITALITLISVLSPLFLIYIIISLITNYNEFTWDSTKLTLSIWAIAETVFLIHYWNIHSQAQKLEERPYLGRDRIYSLISHTIKNSTCGKSYLSGWFFNANFEDLDVLHLYEWIAYSFFGKRICMLLDHEHEHALELTHWIDKGLGTGFDKSNLLEKIHEYSEKCDRKVKCMAHILDEVQHIPRPLLFYLV